MKAGMEKSQVDFFFSRERVLDRIFIVYGNTKDVYQTSSRTLLSFDLMLMSHLKHLEYDNILFYRGSDILECYNPNVLLYLENELQIHVKGNRLKNPRYDSESESPERALSKSNAANNHMAEIKRVRTTGEIIRKETFNDDNDDRSKAISIGIDHEEIPQVLDKVMHDQRRKNAIIFTNCWSIIENTTTETGQKLAAYMDSWYGLPTESNNIAILLFSEPRISSLCNLLRQQPMWAFLYERCMPNGQLTDSVIPIGAPQADEIHYMLVNYFPTEALKPTIKQADQAASSLIFNNRGQLRSLNKYLENKKHLPPEQAINELIDDYGAESKQDALQKIKTTEGWEEIAKLVERLIDEGKNTRYKKNDYDKFALTNLRMAYPRKRSSHHINMSIMLKGNPGTGKTTVAEFIGKALMQHGLLPSGRTIKVAKQNLQAGFVGQSELWTQDKIDEAIGGVLFIDEAYSLFRTDGNGSSRGFGQEVIDVFVEQMTSRMGELAFIFAGYPNEMDHFLDANPGLKRRFGHNIVTIPDPSPEVLERKVLESFATDNSIGAAAKEEELERHPQSVEYLIDSNLVYPTDVPHEDNCAIAAKDAIRIIRETRASRKQLGPISLFFDNWYADRDRTKFGNVGEALQLAETIKAIARKHMGSRGQKRIVVQQADFPEDKQHLFICRKPSIEEIQKQMTGIVGMTDVKDSLIRICKYLQMVALQNKILARQSHTIPAKVEPGNYMFVGSPGTGKTMMAEKLALALSGLGVISRYQPVRITGLEFLNMLVRSNGVDEINKFIKECEGGVLVIDEAHQFLDSPSGPLAIKTLLDPMINLRHTTSFVFCCYKEYDRFKDCKAELFKKEPGLARRINEILYFKDYEAPDILEILLYKAKKEHYTISDSCKPILLEYIDKQKKAGKSENGGTAEKLLQAIKVAIAQRLIPESNDISDLEKEFDYSNIEENMLFKVEVEDVQKAIGIPPQK